MRFGLGASFYNVETWHNDTIPDIVNGGYTYSFKKIKNETIGGISGKIEFMTVNISTPFGASITYFDEAIGANAWLQIPVPIFQNKLSLRLDAKSFIPVFRNDAHDWELKSIFIPMARIIYNF
jgi:hypothetical protein